MSARITAGRTEREADQNVKDLESSTTGMRNDTVEGSLVYRPTDNHQFELLVVMVVKPIRIRPMHQMFLMGNSG